MKHIKLFESFETKSQIYYHTSDNKFDKFELKTGYRTHGLSVEKTPSFAIFVTPDIQASKQYGSKYLYEVSIKCNKIIDWTEYLDEESYVYISKLNIIPNDSSDYWMLLDDIRVIKYLKNRKIDCVKLEEYSEIYDVFTTFAVLNPNDVKINNIIKL